MKLMTGEFRLILLMSGYGIAAAWSQSHEEIRWPLLVIICLVTAFSSQLYQWVTAPDREDKKE